MRPAAAGEACLPFSAAGVLPRGVAATSPCRHTSCNPHRPPEFPAAGTAGGRDTSPGAGDRPGRGAILEAVLLVHRGGAVRAAGASGSGADTARGTGPGPGAAGDPWSTRPGPGRARPALRPLPPTAPRRAPPTSRRGAPAAPTSRELRFSGFPEGFPSGLGRLDAAAAPAAGSGATAAGCLSWWTPAPACWASSARCRPASRPRAPQTPRGRAKGRNGVQRDE